jgi:hypothetical protein
LSLALAAVLVLAGDAFAVLALAGHPEGARRQLAEAKGRMASYLAPIRRVDEASARLSPDRRRKAIARKSAGEGGEFLRRY